MTTLAAAAALPMARLRRAQYEPEPGPGTPPPAIRLVPPIPPEPADVTDHDAVHTELTRVLRLAMEVLDGRRPPAQLAPHFTPRTLRYWRIAAAQRQVRGRARLDRVVSGYPRTGVAELAAVCTIDGRVRALATRFEQVSTTARWRCTAIRLG